MFQAPNAATVTDEDSYSRTPEPVDFRTPAGPEAGWATRNPDRAMLFLFVSPRACGAVEELIAA